MAQPGPQPVPKVGDGGPDLPQPVAEGIDDVLLDEAGDGVAGINDAVPHPSGPISNGVSCISEPVSYPAGQITKAGRNPVRQGDGEKTKNVEDVGPVVHQQVPQAIKAASDVRGDPVDGPDEPAPEIADARANPRAQAAKEIIQERPEPTDDPVAEVAEPIGDPVEEVAQGHLHPIVEGVSNRVPEILYPVHDLVDGPDEAVAPAVEDDGNI